MKKTVNTITYAALRGIISIEKSIFRVTGLKLPLLALLWKIQGSKIQKALNKEHSTKIEYGYISY